MRGVVSLAALRLASLGETTVADRAAVLPRVSGRSWIHGIHQTGVDPSDPYPQGYLISDNWGDAFDLLNRAWPGVEQAIDQRYIRRTAARALRPPIF